MAFWGFGSYVFHTVKWKKQVDEYVAKTIAYKKVTLTINDKGCGIEMNSENKFRYWDYITTYTINEKFIRVFDKRKIIF